MGRFTEDHWQDAKTGENRSAWKLTADSIGAELTFATATPKRAARRAEIPPDDPWATGSKDRPPPAGNVANPTADEPPF